MNFPLRGDIYTVQGFGDIEGHPGIFLYELPPVTCDCHSLRDAPWPMRCFAPLDERELASHTSSARAGRSRQRQAKWADPRVSAPRTASINGAVSVSGGMAARYRSGYLVPGGVERSLTQKPWRPGTPSPGIIPHPELKSVLERRDKAIARQTGCTISRFLPLLAFRKCPPSD